MCLTDADDPMAPTGATPIVRRFLAGNPQFNYFDIIAFQPHTGNVAFTETASPRSRSRRFLALEVGAASGSCSLSAVEAIRISPFVVPAQPDRSATWGRLRRAAFRP